MELGAVGLLHELRLLLVDIICLSEIVINHHCAGYAHDVLLLSADDAGAVDEAVEHFIHSG